MIQKFIRAGSILLLSSAAALFAAEKAHPKPSIKGTSERPKGSGSFIGHEFDIRARYAFSSKMEAIVGYAHFTPGEFTRKTGKSDDTDFAYLEISVSAF